MRARRTQSRVRRWGRRGFSLPELLVVIGLIGLLLVILLPPLEMAHRQATATKCGAQLKELGQALHSAHNEHKYYPLWDDDAAPFRFTWIDVLVQRRHLLNRNVGYCPDDMKPDANSASRGYHNSVLYPGKQGVYGIDYSYGIGVPLSAGGWNWRPAHSPDTRRRHFENHEKWPAQRVLAADAHWSTIYNLSGETLRGHDWSYPTQYDNTVAWRHPGRRANMVFQDGHVERLGYDIAAADPVNTGRAFVWHPGEAANVNPDYHYGSNWYPNVPPINLVTGEGDGGYPPEMAPGWYTHNQYWTIVK